MWLFSDLSTNREGTIIFKHKAPRVSKEQLVGTFKRSVGVMETAEIRVTRLYYTYSFKSITKLYTVSVEEIRSLLMVTVRSSLIVLFKTRKILVW